MRSLLHNLLALIHPDDDQCRYKVDQSSIVFILEQSSHTPRPDLLDALNCAVVKRPWRDKTWCISRVSFDYPEPKYILNHASEWNREGKGEWHFRVSPDRGSLTRTQVYPWEKFVTNLATELAFMGLPNVNMVKAISNVRVENFHGSANPLRL